MDEYGKSFAEYAPFDADGLHIFSNSIEMEGETDEEEEEDEKLLEKTSLVKQVSSDDRETPVEKEHGLRSPAHTRKMDSEISVKPKERIRKQVTLSKDVEVIEDEGEEEPLVTLRHPRRSRTLKHRHASPQSEKMDMRRKSLVMLRQGRTGEGGSDKFKEALKRDSIYECHPGWDKLKKLGRVVG